MSNHFLPEISTLRSEKLKFLNKTDDFHECKMYRNYRQKYFMDRLKYKNFLNSKMSDFWRRSLNKINDHQCDELSTVSDHSNIQPELNDKLPNLSDLNQNNRHKSSDMPVESTRYCAKNKGELIKFKNSLVDFSSSDKDIHSNTTDCHYGQCLPQLFVTQNDHRGHKNGRSSVHLTYKKSVKDTEVKELPKINKKMNGDLNATLPASSTLSSFRYFHKMKGIDGSGLVYSELSPVMCPLNRKPQPYSLPPISQSHLFHTSIKKSNYSPVSSDDTHISDADNVMLLPSLPSISRRNVRLSHHQNMDQSETREAPVTKETVKVQSGDDSKTPLPSQALYKVIFRTKDQSGVMVITAIGINEAALVT